LSSSFGPGALATPANAITVGRLLVSPLLFALISGRGGSWAAFALWSVLCLTDGVDGYLARRQGTTRSGAFLDPLADKVLVLGAMFALVAHSVFWWLPVALISVRELAISMYRSYAGKGGVSVPARWWAKVKTVCQEFAVAWALFPPTARHVEWLPRAFLWVAVILTVTTGIQYLVDARKLARASLSPTDGNHAL
jgi:CDP-diacylglycerol--glycerol-3-phosphate 3-phosphatidyltransferase